MLSVRAPEDEKENQPVPGKELQGVNKGAVTAATPRQALGEVNQNKTPLCVSRGGLYPGRSRLGPYSPITPFTPSKTQQHRKNKRSDQADHSGLDEPAYRLTKENVGLNTLIYKKVMEMISNTEKRYEERLQEKDAELERLYEQLNMLRAIKGNETTSTTCSRTEQEHHCDAEERVSTHWPAGIPAEEELDEFVNSVIESAVELLIKDQSTATDLEIKDHTYASADRFNKADFSSDSTCPIHVVIPDVTESDDVHTSPGAVCEQMSTSNQLLMILSHADDYQTQSVDVSDQGIDTCQQRQVKSLNSSLPASKIDQCSFTSPTFMCNQFTMTSPMSRRDFATITSPVQQTEKSAMTSSLCVLSRSIMTSPIKTTDHGCMTRTISVADKALMTSPASSFRESRTTSTDDSLSEDPEVSTSSNPSKDASPCSDVIVAQALRVDDLELHDGPSDSLDSTATRRSYPPVRLKCNTLIPSSSHENLLKTKVKRTQRSLTPVKVKCSVLNKSRLSMMRTSVNMKKACNVPSSLSILSSTNSGSSLPAQGHSKTADRAKSLPLSLEVPDTFQFDEQQLTDCEGLPLATRARKDRKSTEALKNRRLSVVVEDVSPRTTLPSHSTNTSSTLITKPDKRKTSELVQHIKKRVTPITTDLDTNRRKPRAILTKQHSFPAQYDLTVQADAMELLKQFQAEMQELVGQNAANDQCVIDLQKELRYYAQLVTEERTAELLVSQHEVARLEEECHQLRETSDMAQKSMLMMENLYESTSSDLIMATTHSTALATESAELTQKNESLVQNVQNLRALVEDFEENQRCGFMELGMLEAEIGAQQTELDFEKDRANKFEALNKQIKTDLVDAHKKYGLVLNNLERTVESREYDVEVLEKDHYAHCEIIQSQRTQLDKQAEDLEKQRTLVDTCSVSLSSARDTVIRQEAEKDNLQTIVSRLSKDLDTTRCSLTDSQEELGATAEYAKKMILSQGAEIQNCMLSTDELQKKMDNFLLALQENAGMTVIDIDTESVSETPPILRHVKGNDITPIHSSSFVASILKAASHPNESCKTITTDQEPIDLVLNKDTASDTVSVMSPLHSYSQSDCSPTSKSRQLLRSSVSGAFVPVRDTRQDISNNNVLRKHSGLDSFVSLIDTNSSGYNSFEMSSLETRSHDSEVRLVMRIDGLMKTLHEITRVVGILEQAACLSVQDITDECGVLQARLETVQREDELKMEQLERTLDETSLNLHARDSELVATYAQVNDLTKNLEYKENEVEEINQKATKRLKTLKDNWQKAERELIRLDELVEKIKMTMDVHRSVFEHCPPLKQILKELNKNYPVPPNQDPLQNVLTAKR